MLMSNTLDHNNFYAAYTARGTLNLFTSHSSPFLLSSSSSQTFSTNEKTLSFVYTTRAMLLTTDM